MNDKVSWNIMKNYIMILIPQYQHAFQTFDVKCSEDQHCTLPHNMLEVKLHLFLLWFNETIKCLHSFVHWELASVVSHLLFMFHSSKNVKTRSLKLECYFFEEPDSVNSLSNKTQRFTVKTASHVLHSFQVKVFKQR